MNNTNPGRPHPIPRIVSFAALLVLTLFVGLCSAFVVYMTYARFSTQKGWATCAVIVLSVCLFLGYCWHGTLTEKPATEREVFEEQPECVWPPAPTNQSRGWPERNGSHVTD